MRTLAILPLLTLLFGFAAPALAQDKAPISAQAMVTLMDKTRNPGQPFRLTNALVEYVNGVPRDSLTLAIFSRFDEATGQYDTLASYIQPERDQGKAILMQGTKMYFYDPISKASIRLSPQQRLIGQASNGDVVTVNYARDYQASLADSEKIEDADRKSRDCWHLDLKPGDDDAIYGRIEFWLEKGSYLLIKGRYYSDSGRLLKIAYFRNYEMALGTPKYNEAIIIDAVDPSQVTTMTYSDWRFQDIPASWFQRDFLPHLKID